MLLINLCTSSYPAVYIICVFPISLARWLRFDGYNPPYQFTLFASALFAFSGLFNVILYFSTRREYAVGPSVTATATILPLAPQNNYLPQAGQILNSREDIDYELNERCGRRRPLTYRDGPSPTASTARLPSNLILNSTSPLNQSPVPLAQDCGPAHRQSASRLSTSDSQASRGNTLTSGYPLDDDENDYGRLPA
jgi:hypothetical protein